MSFTQKPLEKDLPSLKSNLLYRAKLESDSEEDVITVIEKDKYWLFKTDNGNFICSLDDKDKLGQGSYSRVFKAWKLIDVSKDDYQVEADYVLKVTRLDDLGKSEPQVRKDAIITKLIYPKETQTLIVHEKVAYLITKRLPNNQILDKKGSLNPLVQKMTPSQRMQLILDILLKVKNLADQGLVHGDLNGANILLGQDSKASITPYLCDFDNVQSEGQVGDKELASPGTPGHLSYEGLTQDFSAKVDLLALRPIFMAILGAKSPLEKKLEAREKTLQAGGSEQEVNQAELAAPLDATGMMAYFKESKFNISDKAKNALAAVIMQFLFQWEKLPSTKDSLDKVINFMMSINNLLKASATKSYSFNFFKSSQSEQMLTKTLKELSASNLELGKEPPTIMPVKK